MTTVLTAEATKKVGQKWRSLRWRSALRTDGTHRQGLKREALETRWLNFIPPPASAPDSYSTAAPPA